MAIPYFTDDVKVISKLGAHPNTDNNLNEQDLKEKFDEAASLIKRYLNEQLVPALANVGGYSKTVLWQNDSPYSKFPLNATISLPLEDYDAVEIIYMNTALFSGTSFATTGEQPVFDFTTSCNLGAASDARRTYCAITRTGIEFRLDDRESNIPYVIYGIKR